MYNKLCKYKEGVSNLSQISLKLTVDFVAERQHPINPVQRAGGKYISALKREWLRRNFITTQPPYLNNLLSKPDIGVYTEAG